MTEVCHLEFLDGMTLLFNLDHFFRLGRFLPLGHFLPLSISIHVVILSSPSSWNVG